MDLPRPPRWKRILKRSFWAGVSFLAVAIIVVFRMQQRHDSTCHEKHPPPGQFVTVHQARGQGPFPPLPQYQHRIHYRLHGEGDITFVLEAGLGDYSGSWSPIEDGLAKLGRVFVYDRAGLGWSEPCRLSSGPARSGHELHAILEAANVPPPYILVGHSLGALSHYIYLGDSRGRVAGLLLLDPSHPQQFERLRPPPQPVRWLVPLVARMAPTGLPQLFMGSPDPIQNTTQHVQTTCREFLATLAWMEQEIPPLEFSSIPIYVLTAGNTHAPVGTTDLERQIDQANWKTLHERWVAASASDFRRHTVVPGAGHNLHRTHPDAVLKAASELLQHIRTRRAE